LFLFHHLPNPLATGDEGSELAGWKTTMQAMRAGRGKCVAALDLTQSDLRTKTPDEAEMYLFPDP
jgi:hypothetical protein